jgi:transcriptional regulator with XRE-family HTH domain
MESPPRSLRETVRQHRLRRGLSQEDLAEITGISVRGIRNLEADRVAAPRPGTLRLLADAFGIQVHEFEPGAPAGPAPAQLPRDVAGFTGRDAALRRLWTLDALGQVLLRLGRLDEAREQLARAHEISRSAAHGDHLHSQTLTLLATVCRRQGDPAPAEGLVQEGLALANGTGDPELISAALAELALLRPEQGRSGDAVREARRALSVAAEAGHRRAEMTAHRVLGETLLAGGDPAAGDRHLGEALRIAVEVEDPYEQDLARGQRNRQNG